MAKIIDATPVSSQRITEIANQLKSICAGANMDMSDHVDAKDAATVAGEKSNTTREGLMANVADLASAGKWTPKEVDLAAKQANEGHANTKTKKAMETFVGELKSAAHPDVRDHFKALVSIRDEAWKAETEQLDMDPKAFAPLRKAFKRNYHALIRAMSAAKDGTLFMTKQDMVDYAIAHNPDHDAQAVFKRIAALQAQLAAFYVDYPADDLGAAADTLGKLTYNDLKLAQDARLEDTNPAPVVAPTVVPATPATVVNEPDVTKLTQAFTVVKAGNKPEAKPATVVAETPTDILDNLLGDNLALAAA